MWFNRKALLLTLALALFLSIAAKASDDTSENDSSENEGAQTKGKSCLTLCLEDGEDMLTCRDYCTMVAQLELPAGRCATEAPKLRASRP
jgi:hypothetical protein